MIEAIAGPENAKKIAEVAEVAAEKGMSLSIQLVMAVALLVGGYLLARLTARAIRTRLEHVRGFDQTLTPIMAQTANYAIIIITIVLVLSNFGIETTSIIAVLGAAGLAIGLALQGTLQNVAAGIMLLIIRPFRRGDYIEAGSAQGTVEEIGLFMTRLRTAQGLFVAVPNSMIWSNMITNYSRLPTRRLDLQIGISYDADLHEAREVILNLLKADERVHQTPAPLVVVRALGESSVDLELRVWTNRQDYWDFTFDITRDVKLALDKAGISIPYPHRQIVISKEVADTLSGRAEKTPKKEAKGANDGAQNTDRGHAASLQGEE